MSTILALIQNLKTIIVLSALSLLIVACSQYSQVDNKAEKAIAEPIINAINQYQENHNEFPEKLELLVPDYLEALPTTTRGENFYYYAFYDSDRGDDYILCFSDGDSSSGYGCCYMYLFDNSPNYDGWDCTLGIDH